MTPERKAEIRARCEAKGLTEGPWDNACYLYEGRKTHFMMALVSDSIARDHLGHGFINKQDADFAAHARLDLPEAMDEIDRLDWALKESQKAVGELIALVDRYAP